MQVVNEDGFEDESLVTIWAHESEMLESLAAMARGLDLAAQTIRERMAPPDGRTRIEVPLNTAEAAQLLGISVSTLKLLESDLGAFPRDTRGVRVFRSSDMYRIRQHRRAGLGPLGSASHVVAIANQKGGVAKTTTAIHLAQDAATRGYRVLLIDMDPQASATCSMLVDRGDGALVEGAALGLEYEQTIAPVLIGDRVPIRSLVRRTHWPTIDIVPASPNLVEGELNIINQHVDARMANTYALFWTALQDQLSALTNDQYDMVIIDTAPSMSLSSVATLLACHGVVIPCPMRSLDVESLKSFATTMSKWLGTLVPIFRSRMRYMRVLATMRQATLTEESNDLTVRQFAGAYMFAQRVPRMEALQRSSGGATTVFELQLDDQMPSASRAAAQARRVVRESHRSIFHAMRAAAAVRDTGQETTA